MRNQAGVSHNVLDDAIEQGKMFMEMPRERRATT